MATLNALALPPFTPGFRLVDGSQLNAMMASLGTETIIMPIAALAGIADSQTRKLAVPFPFRLNSATFRVGAPSSTASKGTTLTGKISGTALTGGVITLTTANCNTAGAAVASTAITGKNTGAAGGTIEFTSSSTTAFVEGDGWIELNISRL